MSHKESFFFTISQVNKATYNGTLEIKANSKEEAITIIKSMSEDELDDKTKWDSDDIDFLEAIPNTLVVSDYEDKTVVHEFENEEE